MSGRTLDLPSRPSTTDDADRLFAALGSAHRRDAITELGERDEPTALTDLATSLAGSTGHPDDEEKIAVRLWHVDLPKLADLGLVAVDYEARIAELTADGRRAVAVAAWPGNGQ